MKFLIVTPQTELFKVAMKGFSKKHEWIMAQLDGRTQPGALETMKLIDQHRPDAILVHLLDFQSSDYYYEKLLSDYFVRQNIPAQFLLPDHLDMHYTVAMALSITTGIRDLVCEPVVSELEDYLVGLVHVHRHPMDTQQDSTYCN